MLTADYQDFANRPFVSCRDNSVICGVKATPAGANLSRCDAIGTAGILVAKR